MKVQIFLSVFMTVFLAELGDKTQLATLLFAADKKSDPLTVFIAAALALVLCSAIGVLAGAAISRAVNPRTLSLVAGIGFVGIGVWTVYKAW